MGVCFITLALYFVNKDNLSNPSENPLPFNENFLIILAAIPWIGSRFSYRLGIAKAAAENSVTDKLIQQKFQAKASQRRLAALKDDSAENSTLDFERQA